MARKTIQGITIEIDGNTTKLQKSLDGVENRLKSTQAALKDVSRLLKLDPGNVELLTQKQNLLKESVEGVREKLNTLREAAAQADAQLADGSMDQARYDALQREIIETEQDLKRLTQQARDFGSVTAQQVAAASAKVKDLGDKVAKAGEGMTKYVTGPIVAAGAAATAAFNEVDEGLDAIAVKTGASGQALEDMQQRAKNLAKDIPTDFKTAGEAVGEVSTRFNLTGEALESLSGKFIKFSSLNKTDVTASIDSVQAAMAAWRLRADQAGGVLDTLNRASQETGADVARLTDELTGNAAALQEMDFGINGAIGFLARLNKDGLDAGTVLVGMKKALANATRDGKSMTQALDALQGSIAGARNETEAMQIATELFGAKAAPNLVKAIRDGRLSFDELSNAVRDTANSVEKTFEETLDPVDGFKTALNELKLTGAELVTDAAPMIRALAAQLQKLFSSLRSWWSGLSPMSKQTILNLAAIAAAAGPVLVVAGKLIGAVGTIMGFAPQLLSAVGAVKGALSGLWAVAAANPVAAVIAGVAALVAAFAALWNKSEAFRNFWIGFGDSIKKAWEGVVAFVGNAVEKIKNFFSFKWELPKIKLPHFSIEGSFSLAPPSVPHLKVDWYRKAMQDGMILTSPTIFGASNGRLLAGGEAGQEAVVGTDSLRDMVTAAVVNAAPRNQGPRNVTVALMLDRTELARTVFQLNNEETRRVGVTLTKGPATNRT